MGEKKLQKYTTEYFLCLVLYFLFCYMITNTLIHTHMFIYIIIKTYLTSSHGKKHCWYIFIFKSFHPIIFHIFLSFWLYLCVYCFIVCVCCSRTFEALSIAADSLSIFLWLFNVLCVHYSAKAAQQTKNTTTTTTTTKSFTAKCTQNPSFIFAHKQTKKHKNMKLFILLCL